MSDETDPEVVEVVDPWAGEAAELVRTERNARLAATDMMVLPDHPAQRQLETRSAIWLYRRKLRDLTADFASPEDVVWPAEPGA